MNNENLQTQSLLKDNDIATDSSFGFVANNPQESDTEQCSGIAQKSKAKRLSDSAKQELLEKIKDDLLAGHPLQAIALKHRITLDLASKLFAKIFMSDCRHEILLPTYEVVSLGTPANKLPYFDKLIKSKFLRIENLDGGILLQPFDETETF